MNEETQRPGDWISTASGGRFWPLDPREDEIKEQDIAHALARINRFGGHLNVPNYSVAQHSFYVSHMVDDPRYQLLALLHDAPEAYIGDMLSPLKRFIPLFTDIETKIMDVIVNKFDVLETDEGWALVKHADLLICKREARAMHAKPYLLGGWCELPHNDPGLYAVDPKFFPWNPSLAEEMFIDRFTYLIGNRHEF